MKLNYQFNLPGGLGNISLHQIIPLTLVIILAISVRIPGLWVPLFGDEATTFWEHRSSAWNELFLYYNGPNQHSFFSFLSNLSIQIFGENEISFRLPSFLAGILAIPLTWIAGRLIVKSYSASLLAAFLVSFSTPLLEYSQQGRGYTLTVFLTLIIFICGQRILDSYKRNFLMWSSAFLAASLCMVSTLPSNIYFLAAYGVVILYELYRRNKDNTENIKKLVFIGALPVFIMGIITTGYLFFIYEDLQQGIETYRIYAKMEGISSLQPTFNHSLDICEKLILPWGPAFYILFAYGFLKLRQIGLVLIFIVPFLLNFITGIQGPPRSYYFFIPFIMLISAYGLIMLIDLLSSSSTRIYLAILTSCVLLSAPIIHLATYYPKRLEVSSSTIKEAQLAREFINKTSKHHLFVIPWDDRVLRYYIEDLVAQKMLNILQDGVLKEVTLIGHKNISVEEIPSIGTSRSLWAPKSFKPIKQLGNINIYPLDFSVSNLFPLEKKFEHHIDRFLVNFPSLKTKIITNHKISGDEALEISQKSQNLLLKHFNRLKFKPPTGESFVVSMYAEKLWQKSRISLTRPPTPSLFFKKGSYSKPLTSLHVNELSAIFQEEGPRLRWQPEHPYRNFRQTKRKGDFYWRIKTVFHPLIKGQTFLDETLLMVNEVSYFDGIQNFILRSAKK